MVSSFPHNQLLPHTAAPENPQNTRSIQLPYIKNLDAKLDTFFKTERRRRRAIGTTKTPTDTPPPTSIYTSSWDTNGTLLLQNSYSRAAHQGHNTSEPHTTLPPTPTTKPASRYNQRRRKNDQLQPSSTTFPASINLPFFLPFLPLSLSADIPAFHP